MRVYSLTRNGMFSQALDFILKEKPDFEVTEEMLSKVDITRGDNWKDNKMFNEWGKLANKIDGYLRKNFLMYCLDYTAECDDGSREEAVLLVRKPKGDYGQDYMFYHPDFTKEIIACFYR